MATRKTGPVSIIKQSNSKTTMKGPKANAKKPKLVDPKTLFKKLSERQVMNRLSDIIEAPETELTNEEADKSPLRRFLVKRIKKQLIASGTEDDQVLDDTAKRMAYFVEKVMYNTCDKTGKKYFPSKEEFNTALGDEFKDASDSSLTGREEVTLKVHEPMEEHLVTVEEVTDPAALAVASSSSSGNVVLLTQDDGSLVEVEEIQDGETEKALVRRKRITDGRTDENEEEWSTWMIEVADRTKEWANWIEETVMKSGSGLKLDDALDPQTVLKISGEWKSYFDTKRKESIAWRKRRVEAEGMEEDTESEGSKGQETEEDSDIAEDMASGHKARGSLLSRPPETGHKSKC